MSFLQCHIDRWNTGRYFLLLDTIWTCGCHLHQIAINFNLLRIPLPLNFQFSSDVKNCYKKSSHFACRFYFHISGHITFDGHSDAVRKCVILSLVQNWVFSYMQSVASSCSSRLHVHFEKWAKPNKIKPDKMKPNQIKYIEMINFFQPLNRPIDENLCFGVFFGSEEL